MHNALVVSVTRKYLKILDTENETLPDKILTGVLVSKDLSALVGDRVRYTLDNNEALIHEVLKRKNTLKRATTTNNKNTKSKELASNVDLVTLITAPKPLFNRSFIDRVIATSLAQNISLILVVNKKLHGHHSDPEYINHLYINIQNVHYISAQQSWYDARSRTDMGALHAQNYPNTGFSRPNL